MTFRREGVPLQSLFNKVQAPFGGHLCPQNLQEPLANWAISSSSGGRVSAPKLLFYVVKSSTRWSIKHEKKSGHGCAWCSDMYLPTLR